MKEKERKYEDIDPAIRNLGDPSAVNLHHDHLFEENTEQEREKRRGELKKEQEKNEKEGKKERSPRKKKIFTVLMTIIIIVGISGSAYTAYRHFKNQPEQTDIPGLDIRNKHLYTYKGFEFRQNKDGTWSTEVYNPVTETLFAISLHYGPKDIYDIPIDHSVRDWLTYAINFESENSEKDAVGATFIMFEPDAEGGFHAVAYHELARNLERGLRLSPHPAVTEETNVTFGNMTLPVKSCDTTDEPIIILLQKEPAKVEYNGKNCIIVQGLEEELVKAENRLLYQFYSVME
ncbi:hypothetical protein GF371_01685 [Candidatus Woesearchaeota archaeon]|nr:hypothetical protein [Candidatus Woesearchaeota archaeon]